MKIPSFRGLAIAVVIRILAGLVPVLPAPQEAQAADRRVSVKPEVLKDGHLAVNAKINGRGPLRLIFDTGGKSMFLTSEGQARIGFQGGEGLVELDGFKAGSFPIRVENNPVLRDISRGVGPLYGLIGMYFYRNFDLTIDYEKPELVFGPKGGRPQHYRLPTGCGVVFGATFDVNEAGELVVTSVAPGSAAERDGLCKGDRIISVNGGSMWEPQAFANTLALMRPGIPVPFKVVRDGKPVNLTITPRPGLGIATSAGSEPRMGEAGADDVSTSQAVPQVFYVPYTKDSTNQLIVRAKLNGKGPWYFSIDTGSNGLFISPALDARAGLGVNPDADKWGVLNRMEIEGGPMLENVRTAVVPGVGQTGVHAGMMGYTVLANFRIDIDVTQKVMVWTRRTWTPPRPLTRRELQGQTITPTAFGRGGGGGITTKFPVPVQPWPGYFGIELDKVPLPAKITAVYKGSPAENMGLKPGDTILALSTPPAGTTGVWREATDVSLKIQRGDQTRTVSIRTTRGF